jgi:hypothetical protein
MVLYLLASIGALALLVVLLVTGLTGYRWLGGPITYLARADELPRFLSSWGSAIAAGGRILVRQPGTDGSVVFIKRRYKRVGEQLVFRYRNADASRRHFENVKSALRAAGIGFEIELTPRGRSRAILVPFAISDPFMLSGAAHAARIALSAMGASNDGIYELQCEGSRRPDYVQGSVEMIPWTRAHRAGYRVGQFVGRLWPRT